MAAEILKCRVSLVILWLEGPNREPRINETTSTAFGYNFIANSRFVNFDNHILIRHHTLFERSKSKTYDLN